MAAVKSSSEGGWAGARAASRRKVARERGIRDFMVARWMRGLVVGWA